jgi:hypothetical protein
MLKVSDIAPGYDGLRAKLRSNWRALHWMEEQGEMIPPTSSQFAQKQKRKYDQAFGSSS